MSWYITRSWLLNGTMVRNSAKKFSRYSDVFVGRCISMACAAFINSIANTRSTFSITFTVLVAALPPMLTWSSCSLDDGIESTEHGEHNCLFLLTIAAAAYCGIMKPEFKPELATRNSGVLRSPAIKRYTRLSEILPNSAIAMLKKSNTSARGSPWKLPPEMIKSSSMKIVGLSVTELISRSTTEAT